MSMRLKGLLHEQYHSRLENSYMSDSEAIVLENVPCEMKFESGQGFMEHESEKHNYLPVFHLIGHITEIKGDFPYNISSLYFSEEDKSLLAKDCLYYPSPDELTHMIKTGKFYSKNFRIPALLDKNTYEFPAMVNLTIIPPPNPAAYEAATYQGGFHVESDFDKLNLPIVYVEFAGSGINRRNDRLLDYYGIEFDEAYPVFALTAESSGYTDPPLMEYMDAPVVEVTEQKENLADYYISPEEEANMMRASKEPDVQASMEDDLGADYRQLDEEDVVIAHAAKNITKRIEKQLGLAPAYSVTQTKDVKSVYEPVAEHVAEKQTEQLITPEPVPSSVSEPTRSKDVISVDEPDETLTKPLSSDDYVVDEPDEKLIAPDMPQQQADVLMDFNPEENEYVKPDNEADTEDITLDDDTDTDMYDLQDEKGADVADAALQTKLDDQKVLEAAQGVAVEQQTEVVETTSAKDDKAVKAEPEKGDASSDKRMTAPDAVSSGATSEKRVPDKMQDIADAYDALHSETDSEFNLE